MQKVELIRKFSFHLKLRKFYFCKTLKGHPCMHGKNAKFFGDDNLLSGFGRMKNFLLTQAGFLKEIIYIRLDFNNI